MMNIELGKFQILSDYKQFSLYQRKRKKQTDGSWLVYSAFCGHYSTLESCLLAIPRHSLLTSNCTTLEEAITVLKQYKNLVKQACDGETPKSKMTRTK